MKKINTYALSLATSATVGLITLMTILGETSEAFKGILVSITRCCGYGGHHWVSKGVVSLVFFAIIYFALSGKEKPDEDEDFAMTTVWTVVISGLIIFGFFVWHFMSH